MPKVVRRSGFHCFWNFVVADTHEIAEDLPLMTSATSRQCRTFSIRLSPMTGDGAHHGQSVYGAVAGRQSDSGPSSAPVEKPKARDRGAANAEERIYYSSSILPKWALRTKSLDAPAL
jgi:hypothetical protein